MKILNRKLNIDKFFNSLANAPRRVLLLDYDGTLAPFKSERNKAVPYDGIPEIIDEIIADNKTRVIIISGRSINDLTPLLNLKKLPEIWGSHGWERLTGDGVYTAFNIEQSMLDGLIEAERLIIKNGYQDRSELKHGCLALHWRGLDEKKAAQIKSNALIAWTPIAKNHGLTIHDFDGGIELRVPGKDKGETVKKILSESAGAVISYLGDDYTDEDAFRALGSRGLSALVNRRFRSTAADLWLTPADELIEFLVRWKSAL